MPPFGAPYAPSEPDLPKRVGAYRVVRHLATGTTSDVLLAREEGPHGFARVVVLKVLLPALRDDERYTGLFVREASAYARLPHPAVGRFYQLLADKGELALVLEYVEGLALHKLRAELHRLHDRLSDEAAMFIGFRLFSALTAAHAARDPISGEFSPVIHGDVNPSNVIVPWDGYVKLVDFGSAKVSGARADVPDGLRLRSHVAPEQARGHDVTARTDLYSACLILWELLTGRRVFARGRESNREVQKALAYPSLPSLAALRPDLPKSLHDIVARGLRSDPDRRDIFAEDVCEVLRSVTDLGHARNALAEGLAGLRFASIEDTRLVTTPNLPAYGLPDDHPSPPPPASTQYPSDRPVALSDPPITPKSRPPWALGGATLFGFAVALGAGFVLLRGHAASPAPAEASPSAAAPVVGSRIPLAPAAPPPPPATLPSPPAAPVAPVPAAAPALAIDPAPTQATITVPPSRAGHRVWIDGRLVGQSPRTFTVRCGPHSVRVGSRGVLQRIDVGCGADLIVR